MQQIATGLILLEFTKSLQILQAMHLVRSPTKVKLFQTPAKQCQPLQREVLVPEKFHSIR